MKPTIVGPDAWPATGPPPSFSVDAGGKPLFMVELAADRGLMHTVVDRTRDNYFFGGDAEGVFATGPDWRVPLTAWRRLGRLRVLYYRVITFDQVSGVSELSVDDQHLATLPALLVHDAPDAGCRRREEST